MDKQKLIKILNESDLDEIGIVYQSGDVKDIEIGVSNLIRMKKPHLVELLNKQNPNRKEPFSDSNVSDLHGALQWSCDDGLIDDNMKEFCETKQILTIHNK